MAEKKYFYGNEISDYGLENGRVDYRCLAKAFDAVLNNDIFNIGWDIGYWEQENGFIDNSDEIDDLNEKIEEAENRLADLSLMDSGSARDEIETEELEGQIESWRDEVGELEAEQDYPPEVFQWYIIDGNGADILKRFTDEIVYYNDAMNMYLWGVEHFGTSWDYVLTDIEIDW